MATLLDGLELTQAQAKKIVKKAIQHDAYSDEMPDTKKGQIEAAHQAVALCIDSWENEKVRPDDKDEEIAAAGEAILEIFGLAGIEVDDDGDLSWGEEEDEDDDDTDDDSEDDADDDDDDADEDEDEDDEDDEEAFSPDDYIEGYSELTAATKIKKLDGLDLEDEDTLAVVQSIKEWEEEQDKPASRVLNWIEENLEADEDDDEDGEDEDEDDDDGDEEESEEEVEEPWKGYDKSSAKEINDTLKEQAADDDEPLTVEQVQYVKEYEESMERPRKRILTLCDNLIEQLGESDDDEEDDEDEKPAKKKGSLKKGGKAKSSGDEDGQIVLTRDDILTALSKGKVTLG